MRHFWSASVVGLALLLSACDDEPVGGTYSLVSVGGESLPAGIHEGSGLSVTEGSLEFSADSLHQSESWTGPSVNGPLVVVATTTYEIDANTVRTFPDGTDPIPDDTFAWCVVSGIFRVEDGGDQLRMVDQIRAGDCGDGSSEVIERVYRRN